MEQTLPYRRGQEGIERGWAGAALLLVEGAEQQKPLSFQRQEAIDERIFSHQASVLPARAMRDIACFDAVTKPPKPLLPALAIQKGIIMPLVRIDLRRGKDATYRQQIGQVVYEALLSVGVPQKDRFQVITEHDENGLLFDPDYLDIPRSDDLVVIQITWNAGRSLDQKRALYKAIADGLGIAPGVRPEDVFINLVEVPKENWSFGHGIAQYAE